MASEKFQKHNKFNLAHYYVSVMINFFVWLGLVTLRLKYYKNEKELNRNNIFSKFNNEM